MALTRIVIDTPLTATQDAANINMNGTGTWHNVGRLFAWLRGFSKGTRRGNMKVKVGAVRASATVTFTSTGPADGQIAVIVRAVVTAKTTVSDPTVEFTRSNTPSVVAANFAAMINTSAVFNTYMSAVANAGVVTVTCLVPGTIGNSLEFANFDMDNSAYTGAGKLINGSDGTAYNLTLGQAFA